MGLRSKFSAIQFRYSGAKGVVSVDTRLLEPIQLVLRDSMIKFLSNHNMFEVCKVSKPLSLHLNRQVILLLSNRKIEDHEFLIMQQRDYIALVRNLLQNSAAKKLLLEKLPSDLMVQPIIDANIDYIHEPFFRYIIINASLQAMRSLLRKTRIRVPNNKGRNMFGIVDEYKVLKENEVFIQYTDIGEVDYQKEETGGKTVILNNCKVVITKNPCHHPGDVRTFTARDYPELQHLKDVVVFPQQGQRCAPHDISGSDLDGDEYVVIWHENLVPHRTENIQPMDYDSETPETTRRQAEIMAAKINPEDSCSIVREKVVDNVMNIASMDCLGQLSNLHLAFADRFSVNSNKKPAPNVPSTIELAKYISQEVDSAKTGYHPLNSDDIRRANEAIQRKRPDYCENHNFESYPSKNVLGKKNKFSIE